MDALNLMTKQELVFWIQHHMFYEKPKKSWFYSYRWQKQSLELQEKQRKHIALLGNMGAKEKDEYAKKYNASKDPKERDRLFKLMEPYHKRMVSWLEADKKLDAERKRIDALYESIDRERKRETA